jgi:DNA-binding transcriptional MerR regulator
VAGRKHLSIGEVLSLLQDEFPDVTISKIRFLESQGLVDPERTPSGYRKFYDSDIERLRWVLRQQRDAFLPLKVIKGRLDDQPEAADDHNEDGMDLDLEADLAEEPTEGVALAVAEERTGPAEDLPPGLVTSGLAAEAQSGPVKEDAEHVFSGARPQLFDTGPPYNSSVEPTRRETQQEDRPGLHRKSPAVQSDQGSAPVAAGGSDGTVSAEARPGGRNAHRRPEGQRSSRADKSPGSHRVGGSRAGTGQRAGEAADAADDGAGQELTIEELLEQTGADEETVRELEGFALVTPKVIGGSRYYSREAATVTRLALAFARHGVEARHLRGYKGAADREAGLIEQVIMPLIRQRNPEARQTATRAVEELSALGAELRAALLRSALADLH